MKKLLSPTKAWRLDRVNSQHRKIDWQYWPDTSTQRDFSHHTSEPGDLARPDVEDEALIAWGMAQSELGKDEDVFIDVLYGEGSAWQWKRQVGEDELDQILQRPSTSESERSVTMCFLNTMKTKSSWLPGNFSIRPKTITTLRKAGLSAVLLGNIFSKQAYWSRMGNQRSIRYDDNGNLSSFELCYQFRCGWDTGVSFVQLIRARYKTVYFFINFPSCAFERLENAIKNNPKVVYRDFFPDSLIADDSLKQWQFEIGHRRDSLQKYEKQYEDEAIDFHGATIQLHRMSRHWLTLGQDCMDFNAQLDFLHESYSLFKKKIGEQSEIWPIDKAVDMCDAFDMLKSQCDICMRWTRAYHERTNIRINLLFHLANQRESRTNTQIASSTAKVAEQTQRDSASMITIAAVTMIFLPGTFISAILSTTFFNFDEGGLHVSKKWWILLAATIPLTIVVLAIWLGWRYVRLQKQQRGPPSEKFS